VPIGLLSLTGIWFFLRETRDKHQVVEIDYAGILTLACGHPLLFERLSAGGTGIRLDVAADLRVCPPCSPCLPWGFYLAEKRSNEPILSFDLFRLRGFSTGNGLVFCSSVAIFSLSAFSPLFIPGRPGPVALSIGRRDDVSQLRLVGRCSRTAGGNPTAGVKSRFSLAGGLILLAGCTMAVRFTAATGLWTCAAWPWAWPVWAWGSPPLPPC
jgi:hypothetical protein